MRKLKAIVFTDIAGFTELSARDERLAFEVIARQREVVLPLLEKFGGQCLKEMGDGLLLSFPSSLEAVRCARDIQLAAQTEEHLRLRMGIHQGDVIEHQGDLLGDGVNTAARLEPMAPVGGIVMSQRVHEDIASYPEFETECIGTPPLKGVRQQLTVYCLIGGGLPGPSRKWLGPTFEAGVKGNGYELIRKVGTGSHGQVWLARSVTGKFVALKIMKRLDVGKVEDDAQFEREFKGICHYEPLSRGHDGLIDILHVARDDAADYFSYVMEPADDLRRGQEIDPEEYRPRNLQAELADRGVLPLAECLALGIAVARALGNLHAHEIVHRDIRPASLIYCRGQIKLADVSFITAAGGSFSVSGTHGYAPIEGPGFPQADVYSLGMVLYEAATGLHHGQFPAVPTQAPASPEKGQPTLADLMGVLAMACANLPRDRFADAEQMAEALEAAATATTELVPDKHKLELTISHKDNERVRKLSGESFLIGRLNEQRPVDIDLSPDPSVSRVHARLWRENGQWWFEDLGSSYGSRLNGERLTAPQPVGAGDLLALGESQLKLCG